MATSPSISRSQTYTISTQRRAALKEITKGPYTIDQPIRESSQDHRSESATAWSSRQPRRSHTAPSSFARELQRDNARGRLLEFLRKRRLRIPPDSTFLVPKAWDQHYEIHDFFTEIYEIKLEDNVKNTAISIEEFWNGCVTDFGQGFGLKDGFKESLDRFSATYNIRILIKQIVQFRSLEIVYDSNCMSPKSVSFAPTKEVKAIHYCNKHPYKRGDSTTGFMENSFALLEDRAKVKNSGYEVEIAVGQLELKLRNLLHQIFLQCNICCGCTVHKKFQTDRQESRAFLNTDVANPGVCALLKETFTVLKGSFKSLMWLFGCAFVIYMVERYHGINELVEDLYNKATENYVFTIPYFVIIIGVWLIRAANGPGISKSLITSSLTILVCVFLPDASKPLVYAIVMPIDWFLDIGLSLVQLIYAAPMMSASLYLLFEFFQYFVFVCHWAIFILWAVFLVVWPIEMGDAGFWIMVFLVAYVVVHFFMRTRHPKNNPDTCYGNYFMVPCDIRGNRNFLVQDYDKVIMLYINSNRSLVLAWIKYFHYIAYKRQIRWFFKDFDESDIDGERDVDLKCMTPERCAKEITSGAYVFCFIWSVIYTVISEMVILLDAVFLLIYDWRNWEGGLIIAIATAMDVDRIWTIDAFFTFCKNGNLVESASTIIWWKLFKMPIAWLLCYVHAKFIEELWGTLASELDSDRVNSLREHSGKLQKRVIEMGVHEIPEN